MITTITLARTFACTFFVAWTLACTFFVAWTLACTFLRLGLWLALFCGLDFGLHVFFVACTLARTFFVAPGAIAGYRGCGAIAECFRAACAIIAYYD